MWNDRFSGEGLRCRGVRDPITAGAIGLSAAGTGVSAIGTIMGGRAQREAAEAQAAAMREAGTTARKASELESQADILAAVSERETGELNAQGLEFRAAQMDIQAGESRAAAQQQAGERRRSAMLTLSALRARAAAGGGSATDTGALKLAGDIGARGEYEALAEMFVGESRARGFEDEAAGSRYTAYAARTGASRAVEGRLLQARSALERGVAAERAGYTGANATSAAGAAAENNSRIAAAGTILSGAGGMFKTYGNMTNPARPYYG